MQDFQNTRRVVDLIDDFDGLRARCEQLADRLTGLSLLFGVAAAVVLAGGVWSHAPLFAVSAGFAIAAAAALAGAAHAAGTAAKAAPRVRRVPVAVRLPRRSEAA